MAVTGTRLGFKMDETNDVLSGTHYIKYIQWISEGAADNDNMLLVDANGEGVVEDVSNATTYSAIYYIDDWITDLTVSTLDTGFIRVRLCKT